MIINNTLFNSFCIATLSGLSLITYIPINGSQIGEITKATGLPHPLVSMITDYHGFSLENARHFGSPIKDISTATPCVKIKKDGIYLRLIANPNFNYPRTHLLAHTFGLISLRQSFDHITLDLTSNENPEYCNTAKEQAEIRKQLKMQKRITDKLRACYGQDLIPLGNIAAQLSSDSKKLVVAHDDGTLTLYANDKTARREKRSLITTSQNHHLFFNLA